MEGRFEVLSHTADTAVRVEAASLAGLLETAALAMFSLVFDVSGAGTSVERRVVASGDTAEDLMVDWLSTLLAWSEVDRVAFVRFAMGPVTPARVEAAAFGVPTDGLGVVGPPIKAVTYHGLAVEQQGGRWSATILFDV